MWCHHLIAFDINMFIILKLSVKVSVHFFLYLFSCLIQIDELHFLFKEFGLSSVWALYKCVAIFYDGPLIIDFFDVHLPPLTVSFALNWLSDVCLLTLFFSQRGISHTTNFTYISLGSYKFINFRVWVKVWKLSVNLRLFWILISIWMIFLLYFQLWPILM